MAFPEVDEAVGGLWDGSEGSDGGVADPDCRNGAVVVVAILIVVILQVDDISDAKTETQKSNEFTAQSNKL